MDDVVMLSTFYLFLISYLIFVFIAGSLNPLTREKTRLKKPHRKLGNSAALASLVAGIVAIGFLRLGVEDRLALALYLLLTCVLLIPSVIRFRRSRIWWA